MNEFEYLDACINEWLELPAEKLTRDQQAVIDVARTLGVISVNGLHGFWKESGANPDRIIESIRMVGLKELDDFLIRSSFAKEVIDQGLNKQGHWNFTDDQDRILSLLENQIYDKKPDFLEALLPLLPPRRTKRQH